MYTPGHASHHVSLVDSDSGALFTGDALGIHFPDVRVLRPATPPPDFDLELAVESIERIRARGPRPRCCSATSGRSARWTRSAASPPTGSGDWAGIVRDAMDETDDLDRIAEILADPDARRDFDEAGARGRRLADRYETLSSTKTNAAGLVRYWTKRRSAKRRRPRRSAPPPGPLRTSLGRAALPPASNAVGDRGG